jgi:hypothetical protein
MWLKAQNEMAGLWPHAAMGPVERGVRPLFSGLRYRINDLLQNCGFVLLQLSSFE